MSDDQAPTRAESKPKKPPKPLKRGAVIYEPATSIHKTNIIRDKLILLAGNISMLLALALLVSVCLSAWMIIQPNLPSPVIVQYVSGQIAPIRTVSRERLPPPIPLEVTPLPPHATLDDGIATGAYTAAGSDGAYQTGGQQAR